MTGDKYKYPAYARWLWGDEKIPTHKELDDKDYEEIKRQRDVHIL